ncbi:MAG: phytoene desaturase family protein [Myxococcaceae bacterium]|nr:phytoene desaturase family protein [Myxococcaceae bacterium]
MSRAIVIGAGVGGLTAAMKLAHQGWQVDLYEKLDVPGGRCGRVEAGGFTWDLGPTIMLMPFVFEQAFASVGRKLSDYLELKRCDPNYRITFRDDSTITLTSELTRMRDELERLEPGSFERYLRFLARGRDRHDTSLERFVTKHFDSLPQFLTPANLPHIFRIGAHQKLFSQVSKSFRDERLRQTMSFQTMYLGVSPYEAPAVFSLLPYTELAVGIWYPMGGMGAIPRALEKVCRELGVTLHYQKPVSRIVVEQGRATGVAFADGSVEKADVVVCNADYPWAAKHLIDQQVSSRPELERKRYTSSGYMLYLGVKRRYDELLHHNVYFGNDFEGSFRNIFEELKVPEDPSFYVNAPAHTDPAMAPDGKDALYVLVPVPHQAPHLDWKVEGPKLRAKVFARLAELGLKDLERDVEVERVITPDDWARELNLERGSNFGLAQNMFQIGPFRPKVWDDRIGDLYYCGASVQPGTGVPTVMISADLCVNAIAQRASVKPAGRSAKASPAPEVTLPAAARLEAQAP